MAIEIKEFTPEAISALATELESNLKEAKSATALEFKNVRDAMAGKADAEAVTKLSENYAASVQRFQDLTNAVEDIKKQVEHPAFGTAAEVDDEIRKSAIQHARKMFDLTNTDPDKDFDEKTVDVTSARFVSKALRKLSKAKDNIDFQDRFNKLDADEKKALTFSQMDSYFLSPEILSMMRDCYFEPAGLFDLYDTFSLTKSSFMYPFIKDHTLLGGYICSDQCGTVQAAEANIQFRSGRVFDWRGTFCATTQVLQESSIDLLATMAREMALSKRITSNKAWIAGDGVNEPLGWLTNGGIFPKVKTGAPGKFTASDLRGFPARVPPEFGQPTTVMHPNTLAVVMVMTNAYGEFLFGEGELFFDPDKLAKSCRMSRYMPEIAWNVTPGTATAPADISAPADSLVAASAVWKKAYMVPEKMPLGMRQGFQVFGPWCSQWHFWAQDGGEPVCGEAGRILVIR